VWNYGPKNY